jgi:hypothetical protein
MNTRVLTPVCLLPMVLLAACSRQAPVREIDWARTALARNPAYEIVNTDENAGVFTVRDTASGVVRELRMQDLVAGPLPSPVSAAAPEAAPVPDVAAAPAATEAVPEAASEAQPQTTETVAAAPASQGEALVKGPGYSITRAERRSMPPANLEGPGYSITRAEPRSMPPANLEGPGYSITREGPALQPSAPRAEAIAAGSVQKRTDPIICQGNRLMRIDDETFEFTGDAVIAEKGCDLYISNARIRAGGVGIIARQARVHIVNSTIGGTRGSYEASDGAEIYVARSTFAGIGRRFDTAQMNDLGGNEYLLHR